MKAFLVIASEKPRPPLKGFPRVAEGCTVLPLWVIRVSLAGSGDFRSPVNGHSQDRRACLKGARLGSSRFLLD
jgi:hypothetical protein